MTRLGWLLVLLMISPASGFAQRGATEFQIMQSDPGFVSSLARGQSLFVRLTYRSNRPVRFRMQGYAGGAEVKDGAMYNGAPPHPAGEGEALVWLAYRQPIHIDEIRVTALDIGWEPLVSSSAAVDLAWSPVAGNRVPAAWASRLSNEQQEAVRQQIEQRDSSGGALLFFLLVGGVLGYFVLQPLTVLWLDGRWRLAAAAPLIATVPLMMHAAYAFAAGANLWPLLLIFCLPVATLYLLGLAGMHSLTVERAAT
jgi:hypothetical protein